MKIASKFLTLSVLAAVAAPGVRAESDFKISNLGPTNTMVMIKDVESNYLLIPVQENEPLCNIRVLADSKFQEAINVPLAIGHVDYYVPLDLRNFKGDNILLDVRTNPDHATRGGNTNRAWVKELKLSDTFDASNREKYRPSFHHTPAWGWMNDPNGMFYKDGVWHLYYQWNPYGSKWQNMSWGHSTSKDLINWEAQPKAFAPTDLGMIFSGSSVVDKDNTAGFGKDAIITFYTSADASQTQSMAYSTDGGITFTEYEANPVIAYERESRDPNMFWDEEHHQWVLLLASALDHEMLIFTSPNLKDWTLASKFGRGYGSQAGVWECPDLLYLPVQGTDEHKWVLICNINPSGPSGGSAAQYFVGDFDGKEFKCIDGPEETKWMDYGKDHYATVSFSNAPDGRHTVIGWMSNWEYANEVPTMQFRSANTLPRDVSLFKAPDGEYYLASEPSPEVDALRLKPIKMNVGTLGSGTKSFKLPSANDGICEIDLTADLASGSQLEITLSNAQGEKVVMTLDQKEFSMDRRESGIKDFSENFPAKTVGPLFDHNRSRSLRIFVDRSSIEAFVDKGRLAMTNLVFPTSPYTTVSLRASQGKVKCSSFEVYPLTPTSNPDEIK